MDNTAIIQKLYTAFAQGDVGTILEYLSDDVDWAVAVAPRNGAELVPFYEPLKGKANATRFFAAFASEVEIHVFEPRSFFPAGDRVAVWTFVNVTVKRTGKRYSHEQMHLWDLKGGRVTRYRHYEDTAAVIACFTPAG
jgi:uncharacterized protein